MSQIHDCPCCTCAPANYRENAYPIVKENTTTKKRSFWCMLVKHNFEHIGTDEVFHIRTKIYLCTRCGFTERWWAEWDARTLYGLRAPLSRKDCESVIIADRAQRAEELKRKQEIIDNINKINS